MTWTTHTDLRSFAVREIPASVNVFELNSAFLHTIVDPAVGFERTVSIPAARAASMEWMLLHSEHTERQIERIREEQRAIAANRPPVAVIADDSDTRLSADPSYHYVRVDDLSPWIVRAVLTAEDGDFFFYGGVNPVTLVDAIANNLAAREIVYGASTISMQVVKMLFLDQERIFSRKLQEVFLVYLMEHQVPVAKERILELYLNLAEFGPGIFGIYDASRHYFAKDPRDLDAGEATWLASILPSPKTYYRYYEEGRISDGWFRRMVGLYDIMLERGRMTQDEYDAAVRQPPRFALQP
jgi:membrane peptidoglycan carboxypeptidase